MFSPTKSGSGSLDTMYQLADVGAMRFWAPRFPESWCDVFFPWVVVVCCFRMMRGPPEMVKKIPLLGLVAQRSWEGKIFSQRWLFSFEKELKDITVVISQWFLGGDFKHYLFIFTPTYLGKWSNLTCTYFSNGLVQPPPRFVFGKEGLTRHLAIHRNTFISVYDLVHATNWDMKTKLFPPPNEHVWTTCIHRMCL